jgi:hypothetical protein
MTARDASESAIQVARQAARSAVDGDFAGANQSLAGVLTDLDRATSALDTTWVRIAARFPLVGADVRAARAGVEAANLLALAGGDLLGFIDADRPDIFSDRRLDPVALEHLAGSLDEARTHTSAARLTLGSAPEPNTGAVKEGLAWLDDASRRMHDGLAGAAALTGRLLATDDEPLRVLILFENGAELRATGGFMGFFAVLGVDDGFVELVGVGPISDLRSVGVSGSLTSVAAPSDYIARYGGYLANTALWSNVNFSPHFPWVAQVAGDLYKEATGERADLVVRLDLTGTGEILSELPPAVLVAVPFEPSKLATDVVIDSYRRFPESEDQNAYLASLVGGVVATVLSTPDVEAGGLPGALIDVARQRRLAVFSGDSEIERAFAAIGADGSLQPGDPGNVDIVVQNFGANKLDLFTTTGIDVSIQPSGCVVLGTVAITLTNAAPPDAGDFPAASPGLLGRWWVNAYLPRNATVSQILVDGEAVAGSVQTELGRPVAAKIIGIPAGQSATVTVRWQEALTGPAYQLRMQPQPLVNPATLAVAGFADQPFTRTAAFDIPTACND